MADTLKDEYSTENKLQNPKPEIIMDASKFVALENLKDIKKNLEDGIIKDINITDNEGNTVLHTNSAKGNLEIIYYLLFEYDPPADVNKKNKNGDTPSHLAAKYGNLRGLKLLFRMGADADIQNAQEFTPLDSAVNEIKNEGNPPQHIEAIKAVIEFLKKDKEGTTAMKDYYDTVPEEKTKEKTEEKTELDAIYDDSHIDNDDDLEDTADNKTWKINKAKIKALYTIKGIHQNLVNYGNNLILFYEKKISAVKELIERKSSDSTKNFVGDATIQDEQRKSIGEMLWNNPSTKKMTDDEKLGLIRGYYSEIGNQAEEIMEKDYNDRNRTIKYLLLIREYEANIESIRNAIDITGVIQDEPSTEPTYANSYDTSIYNSYWDGGSGKKIIHGGANEQISDNYTLLVEGYKNTINSPINDPELQTYLIQYFDKLQFLIADPANVDTVQIKEACQQLLDRINFLKENQYGGQNGGVEYGIDIEKHNIKTFIESNNYLELENMLKTEKIKNVDIKDEAGVNAFSRAVQNKDYEKIYYLIAKGADINQEVQDFEDSDTKTLLSETVKERDDVSIWITDYIRLGADKTKINISTIANNDNKNAFDNNTNLNKEDTEKVKNQLKEMINTKIQKNLNQDAEQSDSSIVNQDAEQLASSSLDESDPNHPLYRQWKALQDSKKERDDNFNKWGDEMKKLLDTSKATADEITKIQNGTFAGPEKYELQKEAIEKVTNAQLDLIEAQTQACIETYTKQTTDLSDDLLKQQQLAGQILTDTKTEDNKNTLLDNLLGDKNSELLSYTNEQKNIADLVGEKTKTAQSKAENLDPINKNTKSESSHDRFVRLYIEPNYVKNNLYEFINQCRLLDSVPSWRAKISTLMVGYLTSYVVDPNDISKHINVIPSYDYFNLVLQGTPGVGKSYSSALIGKALKWCGFLTVGKMKEIKKPDIVGSYTGQTAPKVYNELSQGLGNVVFIDEAYSIAGAKDETKGTFNEFGQEALDAITDYTSEHIGLLAFIVAGYEYEMQNQFLNVNIGLPRRFPTVLTLRRYDMKSFWKILEMPIIKFCPKYQVDHHHHACFELLNIMFNFQWTPNPVLQISKKWPTWWEGYTLKNLLMNLKVNMASSDKKIINIPFTKLSNFDTKITNIESENITATSIDVIALTKLIGGNINMETATFVKAYFINKFCSITSNIRNGDFFRSQADNLTKFGQTILSDKIINPSGIFVPDQDKNKKGNIEWIQYIYFKLYFTKNPNTPVDNIKFSFQTPTPTNVGGCGYNGGSKIKRYTKKNMKLKKYTRRIDYKKNKKTIHKYKNKRNKKTIRQRGGVDLKADLDNLMNYFLNKEITPEAMGSAFEQILAYVKTKTANIQNTIKDKDTIGELTYLYQSINQKLVQIETTDDYREMNIAEKDDYTDRLKAILVEVRKIEREYIKFGLLNPPVKTKSPTNVASVAAPAVAAKKFNNYEVIEEDISLDDPKVENVAAPAVKTGSPPEKPTNVASVAAPAVARKKLNNYEVIEEDISLDDPKVENVAAPAVETVSSPQKSPNDAPAVKTESPPLTIIQPEYLPTEVKDNFSTILNYYVEPSIGEQDLVKAIEEIKEKVNNLSIGELKNLFVFTTVRLRQLNDADLKVNPSKDKAKIISELDILISDILERLKIIDKRFNDPKIHEQLLDEATVLVKNPNLINSDEYQAIKTWPEFEKKLDLKENLNVNKNIHEKQEEMKQKQLKIEREKMNEQLKIERQKMNEQLGSEIQEKLAEDKEKKKQVEDEATQNRIGKDLVFDIVDINFSFFNDTKDITETIVRHKIMDNEINKKDSANDTLKTIFVTFMNKYNEYLSIFESNMIMTETQEANLPIFIYTYLLLACYNTAFIESKKPLTKFNNDSWWFFTAQDFKIIADYLDIEIIIDNFNKSIREEPGVSPAVSDMRQEKEPPEQNKDMIRNARLAAFTNSKK